MCDKIFPIYFVKPSKILEQARKADNGWPKSKEEHQDTVAPLTSSRLIHITDMCCLSAKGESSLHFTTEQLVGN